MYMKRTSPSPQIHDDAHKRTAFCWFVYTSFYVLRKLFAVTKISISRSTDVGVGFMASIDTAFLVTYALGQLVYSTLRSDKQVLKQLFFSLFVSAVCTVAMPPSFNYPYLALLTQLVHGLAQSISHPLIMAHLSSVLLNHPRRATLLGLWSSSQCAGSVLSSVVGAAIVSSFRWQHAYFILGGAILCFSLLIPQAERHSLQTRSLSDHGTQKKFRTFGFIALPGVLYSALAFFFVKFLRYGFLLWLPFINFSFLGFNEYQSVLCATGFDFGGVAGSIALGVLTDGYFKGERCMSTMLFLAVGAACISCYSFSMPLWARYALTFVIGMTIDGSESALGTFMVHDLVPSHLKQHSTLVVGALTSFINGFGALGACFTGSVVTWIAASGGMRVVVSALSVVAIVAALLMFPLARVTAKDESRTIGSKKSKFIRVLAVLFCLSASAVCFWSEIDVKSRDYQYGYLHEQIKSSNAQSTTSRNSGTIPYRNGRESSKDPNVQESLTLGRAYLDANFPTDCHPKMPSLSISHCTAYVPPRTAAHSFDRSANTHFSTTTGTFYIDIDNTVSDSIPRLRRCESGSAWPCSELAREFWQNSIDDEPILHASQAVRFLREAGFTINFLTARTSYPDAYNVTSRWLHLHSLFFDNLFIVSSPAEKIKFLDECLQSTPTCIFVDDLMRKQEKEVQVLYSKEYYKIRTELPRLTVELFHPFFNSWRHIAMKHIPNHVLSHAPAWKPQVRLSSLDFAHKQEPSHHLKMIGANVSCSSDKPELYYSTKHNMEPRVYRGKEFSSHYNLTVEEDFKLSDLESLSAHQRLNIIPGFAQRTGSKKQFCQQTAKFHSEHVLLCFLLPEQALDLQAATIAHPRKAWIYKPDKTSGAGFGISIHTDLTGINLKSSAIVQEYIQTPFLLKGKKMDMRLYPIVTSHSPLRTFLSLGDSGGYARTAKHAYSPDLKNRAAHVTNTKEGKGNSHRLTMSELYDAVDVRGLNSTLFKERLRSTISDLFPHLFHGLKCSSGVHRHRCGAAHQVVGVDLVLDEHAFPYVVEVNPDPGWRYRNDAIWCHDAERVKQELSLVGLIPDTQLYDCVMPDMLLRLSSEVNPVTEHVLRMLYEYVHRDGTELVFPNRHHRSTVALEDNKQSLDDFDMFIAHKDILDELITKCAR